MNIKSFEDLRIWQSAIELDAEVYKLITSHESLSLDYGLRNQMNRSAGSISDNIAEGFERDGNAEFCQYLSNAKASCGELKSQVHRSMRRNHLSEEAGNSLIAKCNNLCASIAALIIYIRKSNFKGQKFKHRPPTKQETQSIAPP